MRYEKPDMQVVRFQLKDVVCASDGLGENDSNINNEGSYRDDGDEWT